MIQINLLPVREARRKEDLRQQAMQLVLVLILVSAGIGMVHSRIKDEIQTVQDRIRQMETDIKKFDPQLKQVAKFREQKADLEKKIDIIDGLERARHGPVRMMDELASHTPERLWIVTLETADKKIRLRGESLDNELVASFLGALGDSPYFESAEVNQTTMKDGRDGLKTVEFNIEAQMVSPKKNES